MRSLEKMHEKINCYGILTALTSPSRVTTINLSSATTGLSSTFSTLSSTTPSFLSIVTGNRFDMMISLGMQTNCVIGYNSNLQLK